jgi:hypothetical protein
VGERKRPAETVPDVREEGVTTLGGVENKRSCYDIISFSGFADVSEFPGVGVITPEVEEVAVGEACTGPDVLVLDVGLRVGADEVVAVLLVCWTEKGWLACGALPVIWGGGSGTRERWSEFLRGSSGELVAWIAFSDSSASISEGPNKE